MANKIGPLIKQARTDAELTQEQLAKKLDGVSASDISKAERGELELSQSVLRQIAKLTGVTQSSLINAAKDSTYKKSSGSKSSSSKSASKSSSSGASVKVSATEKKLLELYREADSDTKKKVMSILKGESTGADELLGTILSGAMDMLGKK